jgi:hypothetical protein
MTCRMHTMMVIIILSLSSVPCFLMGAQKEKEPTEEQKQQWAKDAEAYRRMTQALGGKMLSSDEEPKPSSVKTIDKQSKLDLSGQKSKL